MNVYRQLWKILDPSKRQQLLVLHALSLVTTLLSLVVMLSVIPFFRALDDPTLLQGKAWPISWLADFGLPEARQLTITLAGTLSFLLLTANFLHLAVGLAVHRYCYRLGTACSVALFREYLHRDLEFHRSANGTSLANTVAWETSRAVTVLAQSLVSFNVGCAFIVCIGAAVYFVNGAAALTIGFLLGCGYVGIYAVMRRRLLGMSSQLGKDYDARARAAAESFGAVKEIIAGFATAPFVDRFARSSDAVARSATHFQVVAQGPRPLLEFIAIAALLCSAALLNPLEDGVRFAELTFLAFAVYRLLPTLQSLFQAAVNMRAEQATFDRVFNDLRAALVRSSVPRAALAVEWLGRPRHEIRMIGVSYSYTGDAAPVIRDASFRIVAGTIVGLTGSSGAGKSTLVDLLVGLLAPSSGQVIVDGTSVESKNREAWRRAVAYVPQRIYLIDASIADNIAFGARPDEVDLDRVRLAARAARLEEWIETLTDGYATLVGEDGVRLSGGQRQRIGLARALYRHASMLVLDEATSALDGATEGEFLATLRSLRGSFTILLIAHRQETLEHCDEVFTVRNGTIVRDIPRGTLAAFG